MDKLGFMSFSGVRPFLQKFNILKPARQNVEDSLAAIKPEDMVIMHLFGHTIMKKHSVVRLQIKRMSVESAKVLLSAPFDYYSPLVSVLDTYIKNPAMLAKYIIFPSLKALSEGRKASFPISSSEFGGKGYPWYVKESPISGMGVFANRIILKGEIIGEYWGRELVPSMGSQMLQSASHYVFQLDNGKLIDAKDCECGMKYVNHSCEPNTYSISLESSALYRALKPIAEGTEILIDYCHDVDIAVDLIPCKCGSTSCRKYTDLVTGAVQRVPAVRLIPFDDSRLFTKELKQLTELDSTEYVVEEILGHTYTRNGRLAERDRYEFEVKWLGFAKPTVGSL
ncbi:hypothetical protein ADUPG1_005994 [Aduncisulcus paluster]|uniref:SET domain-containing protein n=1 Tax=Aduncisulcus paluster TaxID=2918883 RepID=A0ABQ5KGG0_9EUKA|nr:hypothetical protein ADUPG1_005994 [Aduncisulcus paluster]